MANTILGCTEGKTKKLNLEEAGIKNLSIYLEEN
jgi:hypothetical protein